MLMRWLMVGPSIVYTNVISVSNGWFSRVAMSERQRVWLDGWGFEHVLSTQPLGREKERQIDFNHMASESINFAYVMKPNEKLGRGSSGEFS